MSFGMYSAYNSNSKTPDIQRKTPVMKTIPSVSDATEFDTKNRSHTLQRLLDFERHNELEQEYRTLKRELTSTLLNADLGRSKSSATIEHNSGTELSDRNKSDDRDHHDTRDINKTKHHKHSESRTSRLLTHTMEYNSHEFLVSDALGIDHFKKHILNVKVTSKRHQRALKQSSENKKRTGDKTKSKFKTVFEHGKTEAADY